MAIGRAGLIVGRAKTGPGQNWLDFFWAKILTVQSALKTGSIGPNSLLKAKKIREGRVWPGHTGLGHTGAGPY